MGEEKEGSVGCLGCGERGAGGQRGSDAVTWGRGGVGLRGVGLVASGAGDTSGAERLLAAPVFSLQRWGSGERERGWGAEGSGDAGTGMMRRKKGDTNEARARDTPPCSAHAAPALDPREHNGSRTMCRMSDPLYDYSRSRQGTSRT